MALLQYPAPVDYTKQLDAFKDFLKHFKTFQSTSEAAAAEALEDLNIDGERSSDEYDFMDDADEAEGGQTTAARRKDLKLKYMQVLQDVANRDQSSILIELDDLSVVSGYEILKKSSIAHGLCNSSRKRSRKSSRI
jgi:DNA replication licensing factor MCM7